MNNYQLSINEETIVALSTPEGLGALAVVRLSGDKVFNIMKQCFVPKRAAVSIVNVPLHTQILGDLIEPQTKQVIDEVVVVMMKSPHSYTGEDMAEITCHSGLAVIQNCLECLISAGVRLAHPGEFTKRAFLNNKIDLAQAESVCDIINAQTVGAKNIALKQLKGDLSQHIQDIRQRVVEASAEIELSLDFPEEGIEYPTVEKIRAVLNSVVLDIEDLISAGYHGRLFREGARVVIVGKPNVGKSSVFNLLVRKERAIVTPHPGTTRDTIECTVDLSGIPVTLVDSAGVCESDDVIEKIGIERTFKEIEYADLIVILFDAHSALTEEDITIIETSKKYNYIPILNKIDLTPIIDKSKLKQYFPSDEIFEISAITNKGINELENSIKGKLLGEGINSSSEAGDFLITNLRHIDLFKKAKDALARAIEGLDKQLSGELLMVDIYEALDCIGEITGSKISDDVLNAIFSKFCIGK